MTVKISNLPAATSVGSGDVLPVVQSGTTKKIDLNSPWSINIDGGNIDGTPIGVSSASSGAFTTLEASGNMTIDGGTLFVDSANNRVGIGTGTPDRLLQLSGVSNPQFAITDTTNNATFYAAALDTAVLVGSDSDHPVRFAVNGSEKMRIDSSGRVGIGTTLTTSFDPAGRNLIVGTGSTNSGITIYSGSVSSSSLFFANGPSGSNTVDGYIQYQHSGKNLLFATNATEAMRIDSSGNVGIGVTSPSAKLDIDAGATNKINLGQSASNGFYNFISLSGALSDADGIGIIARGGTDDKMYLMAQDALIFRPSGPTERMRIDSSGRVGIGTTSPADTLHVRSSAPIIRLEDSDNSSWVWQVGQNTDQFFINTETASDGSQFTITSSGNVGIGTTSPAHKLQIGGITGRSFVVDQDTPNITRLANDRGLILESGLGYNTVIRGLGGAGFGNITFETSNGGERMRIDSSGHAIIPAGVTLGTSAGVYNAANTLDDYEEGTWTPTISSASGFTSGTPANVTCTYTKIGRLVSLHGVFALSGSSGNVAVGDGLVISGAPFAPVHGTYGKFNLADDIGNNVFADGICAIFGTSLFAKVSYAAGSTPRTNAITVNIQYYV